MAHAITLNTIFGLTKDELVKIWGDVEMSQKQFELFGEELGECDTLWDTILDMLKEEYLIMQESGALEENQEEEEEEDLKELMGDCYSAEH